MSETGLASLTVAGGSDCRDGVAEGSSAGVIGDTERGDGSPAAVSPCLSDGGGTCVAGMSSSSSSVELSGIGRRVGSTGCAAVEEALAGGERTGGSPAVEGACGGDPAGGAVGGTVMVAGGPTGGCALADGPTCR